MFKVVQKIPTGPDLVLAPPDKEIKCDQKMLSDMLRILRDLSESFQHVSTRDTKIIARGQLVIFMTKSRVLEEEKIIKIPPTKTMGVEFKKIKRKVGDYEVVLTLEDEGIFSVGIPKLPGCITFGNTIGEALKNAREAIECHLGAIRKHQK
jgi:predicted RNase H-like HicB family nuclease